MGRDSWHCTGVREQDHPQEKEMQKAKWLSEEALQMEEKVKEEKWREEKPKAKGEKERYSHLNEEFQRIAMSDKKAFLSDQSKEIEETNRMRKTRDLFKKIGDTKLKSNGFMKTYKTF